MKKTLTILSILIAGSLSAFPLGKRPDSLINLVNHAKCDTVKCRLYNEIGRKYEKTSTDTAFFYYDKAITLSTKIKDRYRQAVSLNNYGGLYRTMSQYDKALEYFNKSCIIFKDIANSQGRGASVAVHTGLSDCYNSIGIVYYFQGDYKLSLEYYQKAIIIQEELCKSPVGVTAKSGKNGVARCYNNICNIYQRMGNLSRAKEYCQKSLSIVEEMGDKPGMIKRYGNLGIIYTMQDSIPRAIDCLNKSLNLSKELGDKRGMCGTYINLGMAYKKGNNFNLAIVNFKKALGISKSGGDKEGLTVVNGAIGQLHLELADSVAKSPIEKEMHYKEAIKFGLEALNLAKEMNTIPKINMAAADLQKAYKALGNTGKALEYAELYISTNSAMFKEEKTKAITEMEAKYQNEKKQKEIELLNKNEELQKIEVKSQRTQKYAFIGGFILMLALAVVIFRSYRQKRIANKILFQQEEEIVEKNEELQQQKEEIQVQAELLSLANTELEIRNTQILDSIGFAKLIQEAILPTEELIKKHLPESFIFFQPKDIVSGDFYWFAQVNGKSLIAAIDCTGHGVPGAFMSMIGSTLLNHIVKENGITNPSKILNNLHIGVLDALKGDNENLQNGMDMSLCVIDKEKKTLEFAGAMNSIYVVKEKIIEEIEADDNSIGSIELREIEHGFAGFTTKTMNIENGQDIYMFSDGYNDQFGGPDESKFNRRRFETLLTDISDLPMCEQRNEIEKTFFEWKGSSKQIDDVLVIGIKFNDDENI
ncbi:MAG: hypothetical protein A2275_02050 [Bacteroidetes bacterium RIFOXYA12_FULL_35_11]|nr:MAG: hypothetical protein A2275_02050 [Bacteroidetes bacterium RIFOXYA12_FULL_35_11]